MAKMLSDYVSKCTLLPVTQLEVGSLGTLWHCHSMGTRVFLKQVTEDVTTVNIFQQSLQGGAMYSAVTVMFEVIILSGHVIQIFSNFLCSWLFNAHNVAFYARHTSD